MIGEPSLGISGEQGDEDYDPTSAAFEIREEQKEYNDLSIKQTLGSLSPKEKKRLTELKEKKDEAELELLTQEEHSELVELQKKQTTSTEWNNEDARRLLELQKRFDIKGVVEDQEAA